MELAPAVSAEARARIGLALGEICRLSAMDIRAREALIPALDWFRQSSDKTRYYQTLVLLAWVTVFFRPMEEAGPLLAEIREVLSAMPTSKIKAWALTGTGVTMWSEGETEAGSARYQAGFAMHVETGDPRGRFRSAMNFGEILHKGGDTKNAIRVAEEVLPDLRREGPRPAARQPVGQYRGLSLLARRCRRWQRCPRRMRPAHSARR